MTQTRTPPNGSSETSETVQLLVADAGNRSAISRMLDDQFEVEMGQTVTDADLYLVEDHLFPEYRVALRDRIEREHPAFCPVVLIQREETDLQQGNRNSSAPEGAILYDEVVDAPIDPPQLIRRLHSLLVRRQQSQELMQQVSTLEEREQRLRRFEQAVESTGNGIVMIDSAGTIEYMNLALESMAGYTEDEVLGESPQILLPDGAEGIFDDEFWQTLADQGEWEDDFIIEGKDSQRVVVNATATALQDVKNETEEFVIVLSDITERIQREHDLEDREEELDLLRQILTRYLRHNMRNDLNVIQGNAELLQADESLSPEQIELTELIIDRTETLSEMSDTARTYSSLLERDTELSTFDLSKITTEVVQGVRQTHSDVTFELDVPETCDIRARDGIQHAFEELIDNAGRHNDATSPWVRIQVRDDGGGRLVIEDNGPGIPNQEIESLEQKTETPLTHSQGIGLWLSKWLIEGVEGQLSFETTDTGTRVTVDFPSLITIGSTGQEITTLKERKQRLQTIKDRMTDAIIQVDADFTVTQFDERAERIFDKEADTMLGHRLWDVLPTLRDTQFEPVIRNAMESRSSNSVEGYLQEIDTGLEFAMYPEFDGGLTFYARDVTERKEQEKILTRNTRSIDEAPIGITITDPSQEDNPMIYVNDRFRELTGYSDAEVLGRNCRFLQGEATDPEPVAKMREAVGNEDPVSVELRNYRKDGTEFWSQVSIAPVRDDDGSVVNYVGFQQDISDQRRREEVLREMYAIISDRHQSFEDKVQALLELGRRELNTEYGTLSEIRGEEYVFEFVATDDDSIQSGDVVPVSATNCELVASSEETIVAGNIERDAPGLTDLAGFTEWGISCYLGAPVFTGDEVYGTFCFYDTEARSDQFSEWEVTLVELMSRWVSYELQHREKTSYLDAIMEYSTQPLFIKAASGEYLFANREYQQLFDLQDEEIIGRTDHDLHPEVMADEVWANDRQVLETKQPVEIEERIIVDGNERIYLFSKAPVYFDDESDEPDAVFGMATDITERKEQERKREQIIGRVTDAIVEVDADWRFTLVNEQAEELYDMSEESLLGRDFWNVFEAAKGTKFEEEYREVMETREPTSFVENFSQLDGWFDIKAYPKDDGGIAFYFVEVTERYKREQELAEKTRQLEAIVQNTEEAIYIKDTEGYYKFINKSGADVFDMSAEEVIGKHDAELFDDESAIDVRSEDEKVMESGEAVRKETVRYIDGEKHVFLDAKYPYRDEDGEVIGLIGISPDITERKEKEEQIRREKDRLDEFASLVSHDLRNPLNVAQGRIQLAGEEHDSEHIDIAARAIDQSLDLIGDMLALARRGKQVSDMEGIALANLLQDCWETVQPSDATIDIDIDSTIRADLSRLRQLLENLFRNAVEHGGDDITIEVGKLDDGFYIEDDGIGIPEAERDKLFEKGYSTTDEGTGFGLAIVKQIAEAHGWEIRATEGSKGGARFEITGVEFAAE